MIRCRRSNRPGKLSGRRTVAAIKLWREAERPAEGITISGERTEGAPAGKAIARTVLDAVAFDFMTGHLYD